MADTHIIYKTHNSPFSEVITDFDGAEYTATEMAAITRVTLKYTPTVDGVAGTPQEVDSEENDDVFDWETYESDAKIKIDLGLLDLTVGRDEAAELMVYDTKYTSGRMVSLLDLLISDDAEDDEIETATALTRDPLTLTDDYDILAADFYRTSLRLNALVQKTLTLPAKAAALDGKRIRILIRGIGDCELECQGATKIVNSSYTTYTGTTRYGSIELEYDYDLDLYFMVAHEGHWSGS